MDGNWYSTKRSVIFSRPESLTLKKNTLIKTSNHFLGWKLKVNIHEKKSLQ